MIVSAIDYTRVLRDCKLDRLTRRIHRVDRVGDTVYLVVELNDGRWAFVDRALSPPSYDVIFTEDEARAIAWAPSHTQRRWT